MKGLRSGKTQRVSFLEVCVSRKSLRLPLRLLRYIRKNLFFAAEENEAGEQHDGGAERADG